MNAKFFGVGNNPRNFIDQLQKILLGLSMMKKETVQVASVKTARGDFHIVSVRYAKNLAIRIVRLAVSIIGARFRQPDETFEHLAEFVNRNARIVSGQEFFDIFLHGENFFFEMFIRNVF